jgi:hypothetical protein
LPQVLLDRMKLEPEEYVPRVDSSNSALLVGLYLYEVKCAGLSINDDGVHTSRCHTGSVNDDIILVDKDQWMNLAEATGLSKESMNGVRHQMFNYDGWSSKDKLFIGNYPLCIQHKKRKYSLSRTPMFGGYAIGEALHEWAHLQGKCKCELNLRGLRNAADSEFLNDQSFTSPSYSSSSTSSSLKKRKSPIETEITPAPQHHQCKPLQVQHQHDEIIILDDDDD